MTFREQLILEITKQVVSQGKGIEVNPAVAKQAALAIINLVDAIEEKEK